MARTPTLAYDLSRTGLPELLRKAQRLTRLNAQLRRQLPPELQMPLQLARLEQGSAVLQTNSPAWATRLHYSTPELLRILSQVSKERITELRILVSPDEPEAALQKPRPVIPMSAQAGKCLESAADHLTDPDLALALRRLAAHAGEQRTQPPEKQVSDDRADPKFKRGSRPSR